MVEVARAEIDKLLAEVEELGKKASKAELEAESYSGWGFADQDPNESFIKMTKWNQCWDVIRWYRRKQHELLDEVDDLRKKRNPKTGNGVYQGPFAFTITKSPKDPYSVGDMLVAVRKIMRQKTKPVMKYAWYYEDKGTDEMGEPIHPHIHGMYETADGSRIPTRQWQRAWKLWDPEKPMGAGFRGGYHRPVRSDEGYANYIKKDGRMSEQHDKVEEMFVEETE